MGKLTVITGVMGSGKSHRLIQHINDCIKRPLIFSCVGDTITTRTGYDVPCKRLDDMLYHKAVGYVGSDVFIDEAQRLTHRQTVHVLRLVADGYNVYASGLTADYTLSPFPYMSALLATADEVVTMHRECSEPQCRSRADRHNLVNEQADIVKQKDDAFHAVCKDHWKH